MENEIWKEIEGYEKYQISSYGRVKSLKNNKESIKKHSISSRGYLVVTLFKNNISKTLTVHRLVANTFIENKDNKLTVNHIDGNKLNNNISNLEWVTYSENTKHAWDTGLMENARKAAIIATEASKKQIFSKKLDLKFESCTEAANYIKNNYFEDIKLGCLQSYISRLLKNKITKSKYDFGWQYV